MGSGGGVRGALLALRAEVACRRSQRCSGGYQKCRNSQDAASWGGPGARTDWVCLMVKQRHLVAFIGNTRLENWGGNPV